MHAVFSRWPDVVVQFEDFESQKAIKLLDKYRNKYRCFNDDIQGTGCVTLAGLLSAARNAGSSIKDLKIVCAGAGSAGLGVCSQIVDGMVAAGMSREDAMSRFVIVTSQGVLGKQDGAHGDPNHKRGLSDDRVPWVNDAISDGTSMLDAVKLSGANCLLGLSTIPGIFTKEVRPASSLACGRPGCSAVHIELAVCAKIPPRSRVITPRPPLLALWPSTGRGGDTREPSVAHRDAHVQPHLQVRMLARAGL